MRKLVSVRKIDKVVPIKKADRIECVYVGGWPVVVRKDQFSENDLVIFFEIDSWVPYNDSPFISKGSSEEYSYIFKDSKLKEFNGIVGERVRTIKLRGQISQGFVLPVHVVDFPVNIGDDLTDYFGVIKWERPLPDSFSIKGNFPPFIPKTYAERIQNFHNDLEVLIDKRLEITEKLHGTSCTFYLDMDGEFHVLSRNCTVDPESNNLYVRMADQLKIKENMVKNNFHGLVIQGEIIGLGIQKNYYGIEGNRFFVFSIFDTKDNSYLNPHLYEYGYQRIIKLLNLELVPHFKLQSFNEEFFKENILTFSEGKSIINHKVEREGIVMRPLDKYGVIVKAISNKYLLRAGE